MSSSRASTLLGIIGIACLVGGVWLYVHQVSERRGQPASGPAVNAPKVDLSEPLPFDKLITTKTLANGLRYYVRANHEPLHRAELRLVVNAGSLLEDDDQRGLAHFVEHMAFNGTARFPKNQIGAFMESVGMRFGPGVNAETGYDETVYRLEVPTDQPGVMERALTILEDWAWRVSFDPVEVEKERGVVLEEWRMRQGAGARLRDQQFPVLLQGSRYVDRLPIGTPESIRTFQPARLKQFYTDWYRPDLMAVIAVGDFDQAALAKQIDAQFGAIPARPNARPRPVFDVPAQPGTSAIVTTDPEATATTVQVAEREKPLPQTTVGDYRRDAVERLMIGMLSQRLVEVAQTPNGPMLGALAQKTQPVRALAVTSIVGTAREGAAEAVLAVLLNERTRVVRFGFTAPELERQKASTAREYERAIADKDQQPSSALAAEYIRNFTVGEPVPGVQWESDTIAKLMPGISLEEINIRAGSWLPEVNRLVTVTAPDRGSKARPTEASLQLVLAAAAKADVRPWVPRVTAASLLDKDPVPGAIVKTVTREVIGVTEWTLSNGATVVLLPTKFDSDQIVFSGVSVGGLSLAEDADLVPAQTSTEVVKAMGFGRFASGDLRRWLAGRSVAVQPVIGPFEQGISGGGSRREIETMFQLAYLMITQPRRDPVIFDAVRVQLRDALSNQAASPEAAFAQELGLTLAQHHPRAQPVTAASVDHMDMDKSLAFYRARFGDAGAMTFVFVGSFELASMKPLVERYLASLPARDRHETWRDPGIRPPPGVVSTVVERGVESKGRTAMVFTSPIEADRPHSVAVQALAEVLQGRLRDVLREELGATYNVSVGGNVSRVPIGQASISIDFTSDPARTDALTERVLAEIATLKKNGPSAQQVNDVRAALMRDFETNIRQNAFLVGQLAQRYSTGEPPESLWQVPQLYKALTPAIVRDTAREALDPGHYVKVTLKPQKR